MFLPFYQVSIDSFTIFLHFFRSAAREECKREATLEEFKKEIKKSLGLQPS
jgi:hypothetical protein